MRRLIGLLTLACAAWTQTQIQDTIYTPFSGQLFDGVITIVGPAMTTADGRTIARWSRQFIVPDGQFRLGLEPNDTASPPGTSYAVTYRTRSGTAWSEYWVVPTSSKPLRVSDVRVASPPAPQMMIQPTQILPGGAADGQVFAWSDEVRRWRPEYRGDIMAVGECTEGQCFQAVPANRVLAGPVSGAPGPVTARALTPGEIPPLDASQISTGTLPLARGGTGQSAWTAGRCVQVAADGTRLESADAACGTGSGGGGVGGSGTAGTVPLWTTPTTIGDSAITESSNSVTIGKPLTVNGQIESQSSDPGSIVLYSPSGGSLTIEPADTSSNHTFTLPPVSGTAALVGHEHDAGDVTSGVFADARISQSSVTQHQAVLQLSASQIVGGVLLLARGGTGNSTYTVGRCVQVAADGSRLETAAGPCATGTGFDPLSTSVIWYREDFPNTSTTSANIGTYGWSTSCSGGTVSHVPKAGASANFKALRLATGSTSGNLCQATLGAIGSTGSVVGSLRDYTWDSVFNFRASSAALTESVIFCGYLVAGGNTPGGGSTTARIGIEYDTTLADGSWMFVACNGSSCTRVASGVTINAAWRLVRIRSVTAGTVLFSIDGGSESSIGTTVPTSALSPLFGARTNESASKSIDAARWYFLAANPE